MAAEPARRVGRPHRRRTVVLVIGVVAAAIGALGLYAELAPNAVVVLDASFQYNTPPTDFCPYLASTHEPPPRLEGRIGSDFSLTWTLVCETYPGVNPTPAQFAITSVVSQTFGFRVLASNVPVVFGYDRLGNLTVTVRGPGFPTVADLTLLVEGGPTGAG